MSSETEDTAVLVAEGEHGKAVGILSLTTQIDVKVLRRAFYLDPFNYLRGM